MTILTNLMKASSSRFMLSPTWRIEANMGDAMGDGGKHLRVKPGVAKLAGRGTWAANWPVSR